MGLFNLRESVCIESRQLIARKEKKRKEKKRQRVRVDKDTEHDTADRKLEKSAGVWNIRGI